MAELEGNPVGQKLRQAREAKGLSLEDIVARTRIPTRHLEAIENGDWDALPAATYSVGFARSYANVVGLNGSEIAADLRALLNTRQGIEPQPQGYEPADPARVPPKLLVISAAVIALLLVGGYAVWRSTALDGPEEVEIVDAQPATQAPAPTQQVAPPPPAPATGPVVLTASDEVWLRIYETGGKRLYEGTLAAGQRYEVPADAQAPLILTGRPDAIRVTVGTTAIPPLGPAQRTIADVSLAANDLLARVGPGAPAATGTPAGAPATPPGAVPTPPADASTTEID